MKKEKEEQATPKKANLTQEEVYSAKFLKALQEVFKDDEEAEGFDKDWHISLDEIVKDPNKAKSCVYALLVQASAIMYNKLTQSKMDALGVNHLANKLIYEMNIATEAKQLVEEQNKQAKKGVFNKK